MVVFSGTLMKLFLTSLTSTLVLAAPLTAQAADIYRESFDGQEGLGVTDTGVNTDGADWTVDPGDGAFFNDNDFFQVVDGRLTARDTNGGCLTSSCATGGAIFADLDLPTWLSPVIDISDWTNLNLSLDTAGIGNFEVSGGFNSEDDFIISYLLDGVETVIADLVTGDTFVDQTVTTDIADGNALQIVVKMNNYAASEYFFLDNVVVSGDRKSGSPAQTPEPGMAFGLIGLALVKGLRRSL